MTFIPDVVIDTTVESAWGNQIRDRALHTFPSKAERDAHAATLPVGATCYVTETGGRYLLEAGPVWRPLPGPAYVGMFDQAASGPLLAGNGIYQDWPAAGFTAPHSGELFLWTGSYALQAVDGSGNQPAGGTVVTVSCQYGVGIARGPYAFSSRQVSGLNLTETAYWIVPAAAGEVLQTCILSGLVAGDRVAPFVIIWSITAGYTLRFRPSPLMASPQGVWWTIQSLGASS